MSISKKTLALAELIRPTLNDGETIDNEVGYNSSGAYAASLENAGIDLDTVRKVLEHDKRFITALTHVTGEIAAEQFTANEALESAYVSAAVDDNHVHTVRVQRVHEPVEGKPQYGLVQVHSAHAMDADTSDEFRKVSRAIAKNIKAIAG